MPKKVAVVFTFKSVERLLREGGTSSWRLDRNHARACEFAVCTRNGRNAYTEGAEPHQSAFLVGKVKDVVPSPTDKRKGRFLIRFSEYAVLSVPDVWRGDRNPIRYVSALQDVGIDPSTLKWKPMPKEAKPAAPTAARPAPNVTPLTMAEAKNGLALTFGVAPEAIEITIRG
jgi:hypothetical protein